MKKRLLNLSVIISLFLLSSCVKKALETTIDAVECANMIGTLIVTESEDRPCVDIIADIEKIERDCADYLDEDIRASFATARENCAGN